MNRLRFTAIAAAICLASGAGAFNSQAAHAASITIESFDTGWYNNVGFHNPIHTNISVGRVNFSVYNNWFAFDLASLGGYTVTSAMLMIPAQGDYNSPHSEENYGLFKYAGNVDNLLDGTGGVAAFNDLGSGIAYGETKVSTPDSSGSMPDVSVILLMAAIADINAAIGSTEQRFVVGGTLLSLVLDSSVNQRLYSSAWGNPAPQLVLEITPIPLPAALPLFLAGLAGMGFLGWRRNRRAGQV